MVSRPAAPLLLNAASNRSCSCCCCCCCWCSEYPTTSTRIRGSTLSSSCHRKGELENPAGPTTMRSVPDSSSHCSSAGIPSSAAMLRRKLANVVCEVTLISTVPSGFVIVLTVTVPPPSGSCATVQPWAGGHSQRLPHAIKLMARCALAQHEKNGSGRRATSARRHRRSRPRARSGRMPAA